MNKKLLLIGGAILVVLIGIGIATFTNISSKANTSELNLTVSPADATITVDKTVKTVAGKINLEAGSHKVVINRDGFATETLSVTITAHKNTSQVVILTPIDQTGRDYVKNHAQELAQTEGTVGAKISEEGKTVTEDNPIIQLLPYAGSDFKLDIGVSKKHPDDRYATAIYLTATTDAGRAHALNWIRVQGYDPANLEIVYQ